MSIGSGIGKSLKGLSAVGSNQGTTLTAGYSGITSTNATLSNVYVSSGINITSVGNPTPYRMDWSEKEWLNFLEQHNESEGLQSAIRLMNSKLYKELK